MKLKEALLLFFLLVSLPGFSWIGMPTPMLKVDGRYLKDPHGNTVNLHGVALTPSPWFNGCHINKCRWNNYDVQGCLNYNKALMNHFTDTTAAWYMSYIRLHIDPYWTNNPGRPVDGEKDISQFNFDRLVMAIDEVIVPLVEHAATRGLYVILRPPGVCPEEIAVGDAYHQYLITVWDYVTGHPKLINAPNVMFELANEPVNILGTNGVMGSNSQPHFDALKDFFQPIVNLIREKGAQNIIWIPGSGWQSHYKGYALNPIEGENIGYAVHIYPGYWGGVNNYSTFKKAWDENVKPVADFAPVAVTEIDWSPDGVGTWGQASTGVAGGEGFGANFNKITHESGNVSWNLLAPENLIDRGEPGAGLAFNGNPEACAYPSYHWFREYAKTDYPKPAFKQISQADNGDGTYSNPLIFADFPDPDVIRVNDTYYMVSTTMHIFPGASILQSKDLVNWEYCSNPLEKLDGNTCYNLDACDRYSRGQWASSLKYNKGKFYLLFNTLDEGSFLLTADDPEGEWTMQKLSNSYYDPGLFFDEDGKTYVVYGINNLRIAELDEEFRTIAGTDKEVFRYTFREGLEGSHLYKINGFYYIYATYGGWPAFQVALRAKNIYGPYEEKVVMNDDNIHQGALVQTQTGEWWSVMFYDKGAYGRLPNLQPVQWINDWPVVGNNGKGYSTYRKPDTGRNHPATVLPTNDPFRSYKLGLQWGWNHHSNPAYWSLTQNPGHLRLKTVDVVQNFKEAKNTLTQRIFGYHGGPSDTYATIKMNVSNMLDGDVAGLGVFQDPFYLIGVKMNGNEKRIILNNNGMEENGPVLEDSVVYLRVITNYNTSKARFYFSTNNQSFKRVGGEYTMEFKLTVFTGNKFSLFNYPTVQNGGFVDIDWFTTERNFAESDFYDENFKGYTEEALTIDSIFTEKDTITLLTGSVSSLKVTARYLDGRTEDISLGASYSNTAPSVARIINGMIVSYTDGEVLFNIQYKDQLGNEKSTRVLVKSTTFPLTNDLFNPSIFEQGSFDENTRTLITGRFGFGGWHYDNGVDLSDWRFLVVQLGNNNTCQASFRLFDENNYWSQPSMYDFGSSREIVVDLNRMQKEVNGQKIKTNPEHIFYAGIWSFGCPLIIRDVFLSNDESYNPSTKVQFSREAASDALVDVYNQLGIKLRSKVPRNEATLGLQPGFYLVGKQKVVVY